MHIYIFIKYDIYVFMYIYLPRTYIHNLKKKIALVLCRGGE